MGNPPERTFHRDRVVTLSANRRKQTEFRDCPSNDAADGQKSENARVATTASELVGG